MIAGSSPRSRGTCVEDKLGQPASSSSPLLAENGTNIYIPQVSNAGEHPRARGVDIKQPRIIRTRTAVHPRARGEHYSARAIVRAPPRRFIPALAGNITGPIVYIPALAWSLVLKPPTGTVHPRARGEHRVAVIPRSQLNLWFIRGAGRGVHLFKRRFIPALAGNMS